MDSNRLVNVSRGKLLISVVTVITFHVTIFIRMRTWHPRSHIITEVFNSCFIVRMGLESWVEGRVKGVKDTNYRGKLKYGKRKENSSMHSFIVAQSNQRFIIYDRHG